MLDYYFLKRFFQCHDMSIKQEYQTVQKLRMVFIKTGSKIRTVFVKTGSEIRMVWLQLL